MGRSDNSGIGRRPGKRRDSRQKTGGGNPPPAKRTALASAADAGGPAGGAGEGTGAATAVETPPPHAGQLSFWRQLLEVATEEYDAKCEETLNQRAAKNSARGTLRSREDSLRYQKRLAQQRLKDKKAAEDDAEALREQVRRLEGEKAAAGGSFVARKWSKEFRGSAWTWPYWIVQLVLELLVCGVPPASIPGVLFATAKATSATGVEISVPGVDFCRRSRSILRVLTETLAAYRLGKAGSWEQLFVDGTSRRQVPLQTLLIGILNENDEVMPLMLSAAHILTGESAEECCLAVHAMIERGAERLVGWARQHAELYPSDTHDIPGDESLSLGKLGDGGAVTTDNCATANKLRTLLCKAVEEAAVKEMGMDEGDVLVLEVACWHHLRNVWFGGANKALTAHCRAALKDELDAIDGRLRVQPSMESVLRACDKEFSLCANYPKGHGELFGPWMAATHPGVLLFHVERTSGGRQDMVNEGSGAFYMNHTYWVEFIDWRLRMPNAENVLQENLFIVMTSLEIVAQSRVCAILHLTIVIPARWLAGNSHTLGEYGWSVRCMGRVVDILEPSLEHLIENPDDFLDETFMMAIFDELIDELPPLKEYIDHMFDSKLMATVGGSSTEHHLARLRDELFSPESDTHQASDELTLEMGTVASEALLGELRDIKKATSWHLSSLDGELSWGMASDDVHEAGLGKYAVNDPAERSFGLTTRQIQVAGRIEIGHAGAVGQAIMHGDLKRTSSSAGVFYSLPERLATSLLAFSIAEAPKTRVRQRADLAAQRAARQRKEEIARERGEAAATEAIIDALYYHEMFHSAARWKTATAVDREVNALSSKSAKLEALKEQIRMRSLGLGWTDYATAWSKDGKERTPAELAAHLKECIRGSGKKVAPTEPPVATLARKVLPTLGEQASEVATLDAQQSARAGHLLANARRVRTEREAAGLGDRYSELQPTTRPDPSTLVGKRLDFCCSYELEEGGSELRWSQGEVLEVSDGTNMPKPTLPDGRSAGKYAKGTAVLVRWDSNRKRGERQTVSVWPILPSKWNPKGAHTQGAWRLDLDAPPSPH